MSAAVSSSTTLVPGYVLDRYELLAPIAEGGFGQVWLARLRGKRGFEKLVAIKVPKLSGDMHFQEMLLDEARIASAIDHDNVAKIVELGEQGDILYIVMEWIDGEALSTLLRVLDKNKTAFPLALALRIAIDMCSAAHAAHELRGSDGTTLGVVHRDISPQNMLITSTGSVKLIDFGIAKARDRASGETTDGTLKGKIKYMAPEQAFGTKPIDRRADVFALGAVLFRLLAGHTPFEADNEVAILHKLASGAEPDRLPDSVPGPICDIIRKALKLEPDERFKTAFEMQQALTDAMARLGLTADAADLATFAEMHLRERIAKRREAVDVALKAAADRKAKRLIHSTPMSSVDVSSNSVSLSGVSSMSTSSSTYSVGVAPAPATAIDLGAPPDMASRASALPATSKKMRWLWGAALGFGFLGAALIVFVAIRQRPTAPEPKAGPATLAPSIPSSPLLQPPIASSPAPVASSVDPPTTTPSAKPSSVAAVPRAPAPPPRTKPRSTKPATSAPPSGTADFGY